MPGDVAATVDHPAHGLDAEVAVAHRPVAGQLRRAALHVEAIVVPLPWRRCASARCAVLLVDRVPISAASSDQVSADNVVGPAEEGLGDPEADAHAAGVGDDVVGDHVAVSLLDPDAVAASGDAVLTDDVPDSRPECVPLLFASNRLPWISQPFPSMSSPSSPLPVITFPLITLFVEPTGLIPT